ncbi:chitin binding Peritrophin-A domain protein, partial [Teladorsagia circumcincta]
ASTSTTTISTARPSTPQPTAAPSKPTTTTSTSPPSTPSSNSCDEMPDGFHASENDCSKFLLCLQGASYTMTCPAGTHFSSSKGYCVRIADASCSKSTTTSGLSPTTTTSPRNEFKCGADGFYADFNSCQKFIRCVNGNPYGFDCPKGLSFHADSLMCDHPDPSKCAGFY